MNRSKNFFIGMTLFLVFCGFDLLVGREVKYDYNLILSALFTILERVTEITEQKSKQV